MEKHIKNSLSSSKFELMKKKRRLCFAKDPIEEERENAEEVEKVLKSKGIEVEEGAVKKGLVSLRTLPDYSTDYFPSKDLFSNYIYKKYPL